MITFWIKEEQLIWPALMVSLLAHALLFIYSGRTFIPHAQFSVQASPARTVEVDIEGFNFQRNDLQSGDEPIKNQEKLNKIKEAPVSKSSVMVNADPDYFQNQAPEYPELAKQMRQEGLVLLSVDVSSQGVPVSVEIIQSSGYHMLDEAALKAVRHWRFQPGRIGDLPVESKVTVPVRFRIEE